ncbi:hypothetical protein D3C78_1129680 [compost metagenome]
MLQQCNQEAADSEGVLKRVYILEFRRGYLPALRSAACPDRIPYIPFIQREHDGLLAPLLRLHIVANGSDARDELIHIKRFGQKVSGVVRVIIVISMQREEIDIIIGQIKYSRFPISEGAHAAGRTSAGDKL